LNDEEYLGGCDQFLNWALSSFRYTNDTSMEVYKDQAQDAMRLAINEQDKRKFAYFNLLASNKSYQIIVELFNDYCP